MDVCCGFRQLGWLGGCGFGKKEMMVLTCHEEAPGVVQLGTASTGIVVVPGWAGRGGSQDFAGWA